MRWTALPGTLILLLGAAGCDKHAPPPTPPLEVGFVEAARKDVEVTSQWIGSTQGMVTAEIRPKVQGYVLQQTYRDGAQVAAGQQLYQIDPSQYQAALAKAQGELAQAQAELEASVINVRVYGPLAKKGAVSELEYLNAVQQEKARLAAVAAAQATLQQARLNLGWTKVTTQIGGVAGISQSKIGDLVSPASVMTVVATLDPIKVEFPISEQEYLAFAAKRTGKGGATAAGKPASFTMTLANGSVYPHPGRLQDVGLGVDPTTGTIKLQAVFANPGAVLRPGQSVLIRAITQRLAGATVVPERAIVDQQGQAQVAVVSGADSFAMKAVKVGPQDGSNRVIVEGVAPGDKVIVENIARLRPGEKIAPKPASAMAAQSPAGPASAPAAAASAGPDAAKE